MSLGKLFNVPFFLKENKIKVIVPTSKAVRNITRVSDRPGGGTGLYFSNSEV